jgi:hypothetical protein
MNLKIELIWLADKLDRMGLGKEAGVIDYLIKKGSADNWLDGQCGDEEPSMRGEEEPLVKYNEPEEESMLFSGLEELLREKDRVSEA